MRKFIVPAIAAVIIAFGIGNQAQAQCAWTGFGWACTQTYTTTTAPGWSSSYGVAPYTGQTNFYPDPEPYYRGWYNPVLPSPTYRGDW